MRAYVVVVSLKGIHETDTRAGGSEAKHSNAAGPAPPRRNQQPRKQKSKMKKKKKKEKRKEEDE